MPTLTDFSDQYTSVRTNRCLEKLKAASREKKGGSRAFLGAKSQEGRAWQHGKSRKIHQRW